MNVRGLLTVTMLVGLGLVKSALGQEAAVPFDAATAARSEAEAQEAQRVWAKQVGVEVETTNSIGMKMRLIPPGEFLMGSPPGEAERFDYEVQHRVRIGKPFLMSTTEVTQAQWQAVMGNNPSHFQGDNLPVEQVSWDDAVEFCKRLSQKEGRTYRLPTEAEWEYACRAGTTTPFHFGETISAEQVNHNGNHPYGRGRKGEYRGKTTPVGTFPANAWGLRDMHGNVLEWCEDWYGDYPSGAVTDPTGPADGQSRMLRGGGWSYDAWVCRSAYRLRGSPDYRSLSLGFRVVCSLPGLSE